jgi:hypothetical protein
VPVGGWTTTSYVKGLNTTCSTYAGFAGWHMTCFCGIAAAHKEQLMNIYII